MTKSAMMSHRTGWALGLLCAATVLLPAPALAWQYTIPSFASPPRADAARDVTTLPASRAVIAAGAADLFQGAWYTVARLEPGHGEEQWRYVDFSSAHGEARAVAATDAQVVSAGVVNEDDTGNDFTVMSHHPTFGFPLWRVTIDGPSLPCNDAAAAVAIDPSGNVVAAGALGDADFGTAFVVVKLDGTTGVELWRHVVPDGEAVSLALDGNGNAIAAGVVGGQFTVVALDGDGGQALWTSDSGTGRAVAVGVDGAGGVVAAGDMTATCGAEPCGVVRYDGVDGEELWRRAFVDEGAQGGVPVALATGIGTGVVVAGRETHDLDVLSAVRYDADGSVAWRYLLPGGDAEARGADVTLAVNAAVVTGLYSAGGEPFMAVARVAFDTGAVQWIATVSGDDTPGRNEGLAVAVDADDDVVAAGVLAVGPADEEFGVVKLVGSTGADFEALCGNGAPDGNEECDDGNNDDGDCCSATCLFEAQGTSCESDGNHCTDAVCDGEGSCTSIANTNPCDDGDDCTVGDTCSDGDCVGELAPAGTACDTFDPCTDGACNADGVCIATPNTDPCDDFNACTGNDTCSNGECAGTPLDGTECEDFNPCTAAGTCQAGLCQPGTPLPPGTACLEDFNVCTDDVCDGDGACTHPFNTAPCDDGDICTPGGICSGGACVLGGSTSTTTSTSSTSTSTAPSSTTSTTSTTAPTTTTTTSTSSTTSTTLRACTDDATCDDGDVCNGEESCEAGACRPPAQATCNRTGAEAYVTAFRADAVAVIDVAGRTVEATIPVAGAPWGVVWHPDGTRVYVTSRRSDAVSVIDTRTRTVVASTTVGREPLGIAIDPAGSRLWVANHGSDTVSVLDAATLAPIATVKTGRGPAGVAVHPAGTRVYASNYRAGTLSVIDAVGATVVGTVRVDALPLGVAVHPAGTKVYVTSFRGRTVDVVGTTSATVLASIRVGRKPVGVAFDRSGGRAFVASSGDDVLVVVDTAADRVTGKVPVGRLPLGVAVDLVRDEPWVTEADDDRVGVVGAGLASLALPRTPVAFGAFIGTPPGRCPAQIPRCDDADPFTRDGCGPRSGCEHTPLGGLDAVAAGVRALADTVATVPLGDGPLAQRLRVEVPALDGVIAALGPAGDRAGGRLAKRRLALVVRLLERARRRGELGADGGRLLDLARETRRRLKLALRAR